MRISALVFSVCLLAVSAIACGSAGRPAASSLETPAMALSTSSAGLFLDANSNLQLPSEPHISRWRLVKIDFSQLLDESGQAKKVKEFTINLFPDTVYTGVVTQTEEMGDGSTWVGYLKDVEYSELSMVYTSGVYIGHFASPMGVYEVTFVKDDLYRVIQIDQQQLPGGEG
ncbi:MAG: hypothetical protein HZB18_13285 [Chloroflexi bacterium]|nr:hypothetical protein [Chloroflexota bacterium]